MHYARFSKWTVLPALMLVIASAALAPVSLAAENSPDAAPVVATANPGAPLAQSSASGATQMEPRRCSFFAPCEVSRSSYGLVLDIGGPGLHIDYFGDDE